MSDGTGIKVTNDVPPRNATRAETLLLTSGGFKHIEVRGAAGWWMKPDGSGAVTTDEAVELVAQGVTVTASDVKPGYKTTQFWLAASVILPAVAAGTAAMIVPAQALPPPWNAAVGVALIGVGAAVSVLYTAARAAVYRKASEDK